jgi:uncharacterized protein
MLPGVIHHFCYGFALIHVRKYKNHLPMNLSTPLSEHEFKELDDFLTSDAVLEDSLDISMLDGFLTALLIGPNTIMPSQWLPQVWGEADGKIMAWDSAQQAERMSGLVLRHMNDILWQLTNDPDHYEPVLFESEHEGKKVLIIDEWCSGFIQGAMIDGEAWAPLFEADDTQSFLLPVVLYGTESGWSQLQANPALADKHDEFAKALPGCVLAIRDYWLPHRKAKSTIRRAEPATGRNDPCPCGSGKKFKKCCGAPVGGQ